MTGLGMAVPGIARVAGVAIDARAAARTDDPLELARATRWIAGNLLAARRERKAGTIAAVPREVTAGEARVVEVRVADLNALLEVLAVAPILIDATTLPHAWRFVLRLVGMPVLDRPIDAALAAGASVARVVAPPQRTIAA